MSQITATSYFNLDSTEPREREKLMWNQRYLQHNPSMTTKLANEMINKNLCGVSIFKGDCGTVAKQIVCFRCFVHIFKDKTYI
jgi:hypothetical protein